MTNYEKRINEIKKRIQSVFESLPEYNKDVGNLKLIFIQTLEKSFDDFYYKKNKIENLKKDLNIEGSRKNISIEDLPF